MHTQISLGTKFRAKLFGRKRKKWMSSFNANSNILISLSTKFQLTVRPGMPHICGYLLSHIFLSLLEVKTNLIKLCNKF